MTEQVSLEARGVCFRYGKHGPEVLSHVEFSAISGGVYALIGHSGSGKSTFLYLLGLMLTPTSGDILIGGSPVSGAKDSVRSAIRAGTIGFLFQDALLDPSRSVKDNVLEAGFYAGVPEEELIARLHETMSLVGLDSSLLSERLPSSISGGQAQRVALCRALVKKPLVVLADEPTGNLDDESAAAVLSALSQAATHGATIVVATHDMRVVRAADQVFSIAKS